MPDLSIHEPDADFVNSSLAMSITGVISVGIRLHSPDGLYYAALSSTLASVARPLLHRVNITTDNKCRIVELNLGIIAASMFAIPQFFGRLKEVTRPAISALKYRLVSVRSRSRSSDRQNLGSKGSDESSPYVKTEVLGSMQGYVVPLLT